MKTFRLVMTLAILAAPALWAQGRVGGGGRGFGGGGGRGVGGGRGGAVVRPNYPVHPAPNPSRLGPVGGGFGNVVFPGTGIPPLSGHIPALSSTIRGVPYPNGWNGGRGNRGGIYPIAVPVAVPSYGYGYGYEYAAPAPVTVVNNPPVSPAVIINQNYQPDRANPVMREYSAPVPEAVEPPVSSYQAPIPSNPDPPRRSIDDDKPTVYLVAMKDGTVYSAYATWVEGDTLHYITTAHAHNQASLSLVDARLSNQLNKERGVDFRLRQ